MTIARAEPLWKTLEKKGFRVGHEVLSAKKIFLRRMFCPPDEKFPAELVFDAALAKFLVKKYTPKVVCSFTSSTATFIRHALHQHTGGRTVFLAHSVLPTRPYTTNFDFDYALLFGKSSLENILANSVRLGSTKAVLTGSPFITPDYVLPPARTKKNVLFFSTWLTSFSGSGVEKELLCQNTQIVIEWARLHPEFHLYIKLHPLEEPDFIGSLVKESQNITVLDKAVSMPDALRNSAIVLHSWSAASLEAALLQRPTVIVNARDLPATHLLPQNFLSLTDFFLRARTVEELQQCIVATFAQYDKFLQRCREFVQLHLERTTDSIEFMTRCIEAISRGREDFPLVPVHENLAGLRPYLPSEGRQKEREQNPCQP